MFCYICCKKGRSLISFETIFILADPEEMDVCLEKSKTRHQTTSSLYRMTQYILSQQFHYRENLLIIF